MTIRDEIAAHNERVKLFAGLFTSLGLALIVLAVLRPMIDSSLAPSWLMGAIGLAIWSISLYIVGYMRRKVD